MNKTLFVFLTLLVIAVAAVAGKLWIDSASRPTPVAPPVPEHLVEAPEEDGSSRPASADQDAFAPMPGSSLGVPPQDEDPAAAAKRKAEVPPDEKLEMQKSLWAGAWGRQIPDPDIIDMDISQVGKPGGKAVPIPYVEPPPLQSGSYVTNADGTQSMVLGNTIVNADGSKATIDGHQILKSDGTLGVMVGNDILWSDGSKSTR
jgi:hypothetical protein